MCGGRRRIARNANQPPRLQMAPRAPAPPLRAPSPPSLRFLSSSPAISPSPSPLVITINPARVLCSSRAYDRRIRKTMKSGDNLRCMFVIEMTVGSVDRLMSDSPLQSKLWA
ncbi:uncharacterized protein [Temnothorax longispinosus]|uniref:uncharacterized protein n=1 Tax=Temnothorax longispinosus TaxID=300112 RepID=UPI003A99E0A3